MRIRREAFGDNTLFGIGKIERSRQRDAHDISYTTHTPVIRCQENSFYYASGVWHYYQKHHCLLDSTCSLHECVQILQHDLTLREGVQLSNNLPHLAL